MATPQRHAIIIGAGIAGLSTAYWLCQAGWRATVLEYHPSIAANNHVIHIYGPGQETLLRMNLTDLVTANIRHRITVEWDTSGMELARTAYATLYEDIDVVATSRGDLAHAIYKALLESATVRFGARIDSMQDHLDQVEVELEGGEVLWGDLIVGADGMLSLVRDTYWEGETWAEKLGYYYATYEVDVDHGPWDSCQTYNAPGHFDVLFAPRDRRVAALYIWREDHVKKIRPEELKYDVLRRVIAKKKHPAVEKVLLAAEKAGVVPVLKPAVMATLKEWHRKRVVVVGDAAHCLAMMSSQGAGMSVASAEVLGEELAGGGDIGEALKRWEGRVRPSMERLQAMVPAGGAEARPAAAARSLITREMGLDVYGAWRAIGVMSEVRLATLDKPVAVPTAKGLLKIAEAGGKKVADKKDDEGEKDGAGGEGGVEGKDEARGDNVDKRDEARKKDEGEKKGE